MEPKALKGIWVGASGSDPGRRRGLLGTEPEIRSSLRPPPRDFAGIGGPRRGLADPPAPGCEERLRGGGHPTPVFKMSAKVSPGTCVDYYFSLCLERGGPGATG